MLKKDCIIETALCLFDKFNFSLIGVDRIISQSNVSKMTFYKYFSSKEKLIECCLEKRKNDIKKLISNKLKADVEISLIEKLNTIYFFYYSFFSMESCRGCLFLKASMEVQKKYPTIKNKILEYRCWLFSFVKNIFNELDSTKAEGGTFIFIGMLDSLAVNIGLEKNEILGNFFNFFEIPV